MKYQVSMVSIWKQAEPVPRDGLAGFNSLRAGPLRRKKRAWMFDNEIDWVTRLEKCCFVRREARGAAQYFLNTFEYKAEHKQ
jgi:hypothetical protein